jgi:polyisoprenoid-binding protein YceI
MRKSLLSFVATAVLAAAASSAMAAPETYTIDSTHTYPRFSYSHFGLSTQQSLFKKASGTIVFDKAEKSASVDVTIDIGSVDSASPLTDHIKGEDFFDAAKFPTATFKSTKVVFEGDKPAKIEGNLTLKGVTKPVTLTVTQFTNMEHPMMKGHDAIGANATTVVKRTDFNMGKYAPYVGDDVTITLSIEAIK